MNPRATSCLPLLPTVKAVLLFMLFASISACSGFLGIGGQSWKEEVLLHDGSKIIVDRSQSRGGRGEIGQGAPISSYRLSFTLPGSSKSIEWTSEYSKDVGRANLEPLALHVLNGVPYVIAEPNLCLAYNKWGRPNPPYVIFKYDGKNWQRITMKELPAEFTEMNLVNNTKDHAAELMSVSVVSAEAVNRFNSSLRDSPVYGAIRREPMPEPEITTCGPMVHYRCGWFGTSPDGTFDKRSADIFCNN